MFVSQNSDARLPVRLIDATGAPATGKSASDILNHAAFVVKADGSTASVALTDGTNWIQIDASKAPGLYHLLLPASVLDQVGPVQVAIVPQVTAFVPIILAGDVTSVTSDAALARKVLKNRWKVFATSPPKFVIYDDDGTTPLFTFDIKDSSGSPSGTNIFERVFHHQGLP